MSDIDFQILLALHKHGEIRGTKKLARILDRERYAHHICARAWVLARYGMIEIIRARAPRPTIYRDLGVLKVKR